MQSGRDRSRVSRLLPEMTSQKHMTGKMYMISHEIIYYILGRNIRHEL